MKTLSIALAVFLASTTLSNAQSNRIEIEIDPLAYALGGGSGHLAYTVKNMRYQLGYGQLTLPESLQNHENIRESFKAISFKWDYLFGKEDASSGFFAGPTIDYLFLTYEGGDDQYKENQLSLGIRTGYKFDLFKKNSVLKGLYLTPWIGASWFTNPGDIELGGESYSRSATTIFPTVHLGWSF